MLLEVARLLREDASISENGPTLKGLIVAETGKLANEAALEIEESAAIITYYAESASRLLSPKPIAVARTAWPTSSSTIVFEPVGVVGIIKPWLNPLELPVCALAPALMSGNSVVFKPSEISSHVGLHIGHLFSRAGLPRGVLNIVTGGAETGQQLTALPGVDLISFTGSTSTGKQVATACARNLRRMILELGGNDAAIVCADADLQMAANGVTWGAFVNAGQTCASVQRCYVEMSVAESFISLVLERACELRLGVEIPPLVGESQLTRVESQVAEAIDQGALLLCGGRRANRSDMGSGIEPGSYYLPTILQVRPGLQVSLLSEETFGPVLPIVVVDSVEQAIMYANDTAFGLGASIWSLDLPSARSLASQLQSGIVWINDVNLSFPDSPWGGVKASGIGVELSEEGLYEYTVAKHVCEDSGRAVSRPWWYPYRAA